MPEYPPTGSLIDDARADGRIPDRIGPYKVLGVLDEPLRREGIKVPQLMLTRTLIRNWRTARSGLPT